MSASSQRTCWSFVTGLSADEANRYPTVTAGYQAVAVFAVGVGCNGSTQMDRSTRLSEKLVCFEVGSRKDFFSSVPGRSQVSKCHSLRYESDESGANVCEVQIVSYNAGRDIQCYQRFPTTFW